MYVERIHGARNQMRRNPGLPTEIYRLTPLATGSKRHGRPSVAQMGGWREDIASELLRSA